MRSCGRKLLVRVRAPRKVATPATRPPGPLSCAQGLVKSLKRREARREAKNRNRNACCPSLAGRMTTEEEAAPETKSARTNHRADQSPVACAQLLSSTVVLHGDSVTRLDVIADLARSPRTGTPRSCSRSRPRCPVYACRAWLDGHGTQDEWAARKRAVPSGTVRNNGRGSRAEVQKESKLRTYRPDLTCSQTLRVPFAILRTACTVFLQQRPRSSPISPSLRAPGAAGALLRCELRARDGELVLQALEPAAAAEVLGFTVSQMGRSSRPAKKYTGSMSYVIRLRTRCPGILHECGNAGAVPPQTRCSPSKTGPSRFCCDFFVRVLPGHPVCSLRGDQHRGVAPTALLAREGLVLTAAQPALLTCAESPASSEDCGETTK